MSLLAQVPLRESTLTTLSEITKAIKGLNVGEAPRPNGMPNRVLRHLPKRAITFLTKVFNAVLRNQYFPPIWKDAGVLHIMKTGKDPTLPLSYRPTSLVDTVGKLFHKILFSRVVGEINGLGLLREEQLDSDPSTTRRCSWPALLKELTEIFTRSG
jgi:hypothetical protein